MLLQMERRKHATRRFDRAQEKVRDTMKRGYAILTPKKLFAD
jgi:hypothetical protein